MRTSCAMIALSVTPPTEDEGVKVDGVVEAGGAAVTVWGCSVSGETWDRRQRNGKGVA